MRWNLLPPSLPVLDSKRAKPTFSAASRSFCSLRARALDTIASSFLRSASLNTLICCLCLLLPLSVGAFTRTAPNLVGAEEEAEAEAEEGGWGDGERPVEAVERCRLVWRSGFDAAEAEDAEAGLPPLLLLV